MGAHGSKDNISSASETLERVNKSSNSTRSASRLAVLDDEVGVGGAPPTAASSSRPSPSLLHALGGQNVFTQHDGECFRIRKVAPKRVLISFFYTEALMLSRVPPPLDSEDEEEDAHSSRKCWSMTDNNNGAPSSSAAAAISSAAFPVYIVAFDFIGCGEGQLTVKTGDYLQLLAYHATQEWCEVQSMRSGEIGWVPLTYINPVAGAETQLENYSWSV